MTSKRLLPIIALFISGICCSSAVISQTVETDGKVNFSGYVDAYYARYNDQSIGNNQPEKFGAVSPYNNQFGLNIAALSADYKSANTRALVTLQYGDLPTVAWAPTGNYNMVQEAWAGVKLNKNLWVDAGLFKTHIGTEMLYPKDNITSSITVITLYEPWSQAGVRFTYTPSEKLELTFHLLNGYNTFINVNKEKSFGFGLTYTINDKSSFGYYNILGEALPDNDSVSHVRLLNNFIYKNQFTPKLYMLVGVDYIFQEHSDQSDSKKSAVATSALVTLQYKFKKDLAGYGRIEYFNDPNGVLVTPVATPATDPSYTCSGLTLGLEKKFTKNSYLRIEGRDLRMKDNEKIFLVNKTPSNERLEYMFCFGLWF